MKKFEDDLERNRKFHASSALAFIKQYKSSDLFNRKYQKMSQEVLDLRYVWSAMFVGTGIASIFLVLMGVFWGYVTSVISISFLFLSVIFSMGNDKKHEEKAKAWKIAHTLESKGFMARLSEVADASLVAEMENVLMGVYSLEQYICLYNKLRLNLMHVVLIEDENDKPKKSKEDVLIRSQRRVMSERDCSLVVTEEVKQLWNKSKPYESTFCGLSKR